MNEIDKFFDGLPSQDRKVADVLDDKKPEVSTEQVPPATDPEGEEGHKNRRHRRLEDALQRERESNIALNERVRALAEAREYAATAQNNENIDPRLARVFGDSDIGKQIARDFSEILSEETERAKAEALAEFQQYQESAVQEQKQYESIIDSELENLEETHGIDLTSDSPAAKRARTQFLGMIETLSPKDEDGGIIGYADFESTFDIYQKTHTQDNSATIARRNELAGRSMQRSAPAGSQQPTITPGFRGWKKDYGFNQ